MCKPERTKAVQDETWWKLIFALFMASLTAVGRAMWHSRAVRRGDYQVTLRLVFSEVPIVIGMTVVAGAVVEWAGLHGWQAYAVCVVLGWLGPHGLVAYAERYLDSRAGRGKE